MPCWACFAARRRPVTLRCAGVGIYLSLTLHPEIPCRVHLQHTVPPGVVTPKALIPDTMVHEQVVIEL